MAEPLRGGGGVKWPLRKKEEKTALKILLPLKNKYHFTFDYLSKYGHIILKDCR